MKARYPDTILLFRLGDFYETFEEDAKTTAGVLGITLTRRGNGAAGEIPLAGFPYHALDAYLPKLLKAGHKVAVCEQLEDPKLAKGIVKRDVVEVVTPGVAYSDKVLHQKQNNYLLAVALSSSISSGDDLAGLSYIDVSTGEFCASQLPLRQLAAQVASLAPSEIIIQKRDQETIRQLLGGTYAGLYSRLDDWIFHYDYAYELLINHFRTQSLKGFGIEGLNMGIVAAGAIMNYLQENQKSNLLHVRRIAPYHFDEFIHLDEATKRNLEISTSLDGSPDGTLFWVLDKTETPMGARLLKKWITLPLRQPERVHARLEGVDELVRSADMRKSLRTMLTGFGDFERVVARICTNRATPREVGSLLAMMTRTREIKCALDPLMSEMFRAISSMLDIPGKLHDELSTALSEELPQSLSEGGVIRNGYNAELDGLREIMLNGKTWIANLQKTERETTGIASLKIGYNNVFGYYIEITNAHKSRIPASYTRKQTLANAERYITPELKDYEERILHAEEKTQELELRLFNDLRMRIADEARLLQQNAHAIAELDAALSLASAAVEYRYVRPIIDEGTRIDIKGGRHPVIERILPPGERYTPNDVSLDSVSDQILIITGPNMSGKSSYLRQVGLIVLLAQVGSFVPATSARIGLVDRIFTRVGASDNITAGESTFLVEMHEAANIVNTATRKSLILLDEVGRGTSTFDGISIAWALTEHLHNVTGAKTLFATHYHELNELAGLFPRIRNMKVDVREYGDKIIFQHTVTPGFADHSYGIQVAQMAGLPEEVTERAKEILKNLEGSHLNVHGANKAETLRKAPPPPQLTLFELKDDAIREELASLEIEKMTPLEALQKLADLKRQVNSK